VPTDLVVIHCGGNDIGNEETPEAAAERLLSKVNQLPESVKKIILCSVVLRREGAPRVAVNYQSLAIRFNVRLKERVEGDARLRYHQHDRRLIRHLHRDGVHVGEDGQNRLFCSFKRAISQNT